MINCLIVDDQEIIRQSLSMMLEGKQNIHVVGTAKDGQEAIGLVRKLKPDLVIMDIRMPGMDGLQCLKIIKSVHKAIKVLMLTTFDDDAYVYEALKNGANGFLLKGVLFEDLLKSIDMMMQGKAAIDVAISQKVVALFAQLAKGDYSFQAGDMELEGLNINEKRIMQQIGRGLSNKEIAIHLSFTEGTVRNYISGILKKLDLRDRTQIAICAIQSGMMLKDFEV